MRTPRTCSYSLSPYPLNVKPARKLGGNTDTKNAREEKSASPAYLSELHFQLEKTDPCDVCTRTRTGPQGQPPGWAGPRTGQAGAHRRGAGPPPTPYGPTHHEPGASEARGRRLHAPASGGPASLPPSSADRRLTRTADPGGGRGGRPHSSAQMQRRRSALSVSARQAWLAGTLPRGDGKCVRIWIPGPPSRSLQGKLSSGASPGQSQCSARSKSCCTHSTQIMSWKMFSSLL